MDIAKHVAAETNAGNVSKIPKVPNARPPSSPIPRIIGKPLSEKKKDVRPQQALTWQSKGQRERFKRNSCN